MIARCLNLDPLETTDGLSKSQRLAGYIQNEYPNPISISNDWNGIEYAQLYIYLYDPQIAYSSRLISGQI